MEIQTSKNNLLFRIKPKDPARRVEGDVVTRGRLMLGRAESCDVIIDDDAISAVHAVLEIFEGRARIYDMNSTNGTWVGGKRIVVADLNPGDSFSLSNIDLSLLAYRPDDELPPVLDALEPSKGIASTKNAPPELPSIPKNKKEKKSDKLPPLAPKVSEDVPYLVYPLAVDPLADNSEYIFETPEALYPIFKYEPTKHSVEVIILFNDRVFSVDYLPEADGSYGLAGYEPTDNELVFPYLGKSEKISFVDIRGGVASVHKLPGYEILHLSEKQSKAVNQGMGTVDLQPQDILRFHKGGIQIFLRRVEAPPKVAAAPLMRRDPVLRKYLFLFLLITLAFSGAIQFAQFEKEEETKEEKAPERLATILYKQEKMLVSKNVAVDKSKIAPKRVQKSPEIKTPVKQPDVKPPERPAVKNAEKTDNKTQGSKTAKQTKVVRRGNPSSTNKAEAKAGGPASGQKRPGAAAGTSSSAFSGAKSSGPVEVYKSADFSSNMNSLLAKGGTVSSVKGANIASGEGGSNSFGSGIATGQGSGTLQKATVTSSTGSLTGAASGVIGTATKGAEGLSSKTTIYTAGIPSETVVLGSMDPDVIRRILMDNLPKFRFCYQSELERSGDEKTQGVIKLNFVIGASGNVTQAGVDDSSSLPGGVKRCVVSVLRGIQFPSPMGGGTVEVKQPMNFYPKKI